MEAKEDLKPFPVQLFTFCITLMLDILLFTEQSSKNLSCSFREAGSAVILHCMHNEEILHVFLFSTSNHMFNRAIWDKLPECIPKIFKNHESDLTQTSPEPNMWLLVNHTKPRNTSYWNYYLLTVGNYKSASGQLKNSRQLQNNSLNGAMSITRFFFLSNAFFQLNLSVA